MSFWILVILVVVVAMMFGPLLMLQPSATQRRQERLRTRAFELGLRVHILKLPPKATDVEAPESGPAYCVPARHSRGPRPWLLRRGVYAHELNFVGHWYWQGEPASPAQQVLLRTQVALLPEGVSALSAGRHGWCAYWDERGDEALLPVLAQLLQALAASDPALPPAAAQD